MATNYQAMQVAAVVQKSGTKQVGKPGDVKPRYMVAGSWRADASKGGAYRAK